MKKQLFICFVCAMITSMPFGLKAEDKYNDYASKPDVFSVMSDLMFVRPLSVIGSAITGSVFVIGVPVAYPLDAADRNFTTLVKGPVNYTLLRPIGVFNPDKGNAKAINDNILEHYGKTLDGAYSYIDESDTDKSYTEGR